MYSKSLSQNATITTLTTIGQSVLNLALVVYLARVLEPTTYGVFNYTCAIIGMVGVLAYLGVPSLLARELSRTHSQKTVVTQGVSLILIISFTVTIGFIGVVQVIPGLYHYRLLFDLWSIFLVFNSVSPRWIFTALGNLWIPSVGDLIGTVVRIGFTLWLVHDPGDVVRAVVITSVSLGLPILGEYLWLYCWVPFKLEWIPISHVCKVIRSALPLGITGFVGMLYYSMDTWILHIFVGSKAVGIYSAAYRPVVFLATFSGVYFNLSFPILSRLSVADRPLTQHVLRLATISLAAFIIPLGVGTDLVASPLLQQAFGLPYTASGVVLAILIWSWCFGIVRDTFSTTLIAANQEVRFVRIFTVVGVINLGLMLILVHWGPLGTASALVITQTLLLVLCVREVRHVVPHPIDWHGQRVYLFKILINTVIMGVCVRVVRPYVPVEVAIGVGIVTYSGMTWWTKSFPWREVLTTIRR